jgi:mannose-6-phosphate isomerase
MDTSALRPLALAQNPVYRFYQGGELLGRFRGVHQPQDGHHPEDWVGSVTRASNPPEHSSPDEGLSHVHIGSDATVPIASLLAEDPGAIAGAGIVERFGSTTGVLVKLLDAGVRLPIHAHPSRAFALEHFGSPFGKAEAWIVLQTRQIPGALPPGVRLGFRDPVGAGRMLEMVREQRVSEMAEAMHFLPVTAGDVIFVPPGLPHAIGAGVFMLEVQEPTDLSFVLEWEGFSIDPTVAGRGLGWETLGQTLDAGPVSEERVRELRRTPTPMATVGTGRLESLLGSMADDYFCAYRLQVSGPADWPCGGRYAVAVVTSGAGQVSNRHGDLSVRRGDSFVVFAAAPPVTIHGSLELVIFTGPLP